MRLITKDVIRLSSITLQPDGKIYSDSKTLFLAPRLHALLVCLASRTGELVTKEQIMSEVWPDVVVEDSSVPQVVKRLRQTLEELEPGVEFIETVPKRGYRLLARAEKASAAPESISTTEDRPLPVEPGVLPAEWTTRRRWIWGAVAGLAGVGVASAVWSRLSFSQARARALHAEGLALWNQRTYRTGYALRKFQEAVQLDPQFAPGWVGIANCLLFTSKVPPQAEEAIRKALAIDPGCGGAYASLGFLQMVHRWDWVAAAESFEQGTQLAPDDYTAQHWFGLYYSLIRRFAPARDVLQNALRLNPGAIAVQSDLFRVRFRMGEKAAALDGWQSLKPDQFSQAARNLSTHHAHLGQYKEAAAIWLRLLIPEQQDVLRSCFEKEGWHAFLERAASTLDPLAAAYQVAQMRAMSGRHDLALAALEQAFSSDRFPLFELNHDIAFEGMREMPAFQALLRRIGFPE